MTAPIRKIRIVDRRVQYRLIGVVAVSGALICLMAVFGVRMISSEIMNVLIDNDVNQTVVIELLSKLNKISLYLVVFISATLACAWTAATYLSNRVAGPIFNIVRALDEYLDGNKARRIVTRKHDFFDPLVDKINAVLEEKSPLGEKSPGG